MKEIRERLTYRDADGYAMMKERGGFKREGVERLAEFEDTTLSPQDCREYKKFEDELIASGKTFGQLIELLNADKEGRLVVLPCKVGDKNLKGEQK